MPVFAFCRQISGAEFEEQKLASSQKAMEELLEILLTDQKISEKDRRKKLKQVTKHSSNAQSTSYPRGVDWYRSSVELITKRRSYLPQVRVCLPVKSDWAPVPHVFDSFTPLLCV